MRILMSVVILGLAITHAPAQACSPPLPPTQLPAQLDGESKDDYIARLTKISDDKAAADNAKWRADNLKIEQKYWDSAKTIGLYEVSVQTTGMNGDVISVLAPVEIERGSKTRNIVARASPINPPCGSNAWSGPLPYAQAGSLIMIFSDVESPKSRDLNWVIYRKDAADPRTLALFDAVAARAKATAKK